MRPNAIMAIEMAMKRAPANRRRSIAEARHDLAAIVHEVEQGTHVEVTRRGAPVAVIVPIADYERAEKGKDFWKAYLEWRKGVDLRKLRIGRSFMKGVRDRSPGRDFNW